MPEMDSFAKKKWPDNSFSVWGYNTLFPIWALEFWSSWTIEFYISRFCGTICGTSNKNDLNGGIWQSRISKSLAEYVHRCVCFVNVQLSLPENVVFSGGARMGNAAYIIFIMWNSMSGLDSWYHFRLNIICDVAVLWEVINKKFR